MLDIGTDFFAKSLNTHRIIPKYWARVRGTVNVFGIPRASNFKKFLSNFDVEEIAAFC